jgi:hypothetical protein
VKETDDREMQGEMNEKSHNNSFSANDKKYTFVE